MCAIYPSRESVVPTWKGQDATVHALSLRPPSPAPGPSVKAGRPALPLSVHFPHSASSISCCGLLVALVLLAGPGYTQSAPSISIALSPGHAVPQNTALTATITLNNLDAASYSSLIFRADLTEFDPHFEAASASCEDEDMGEDITIEVDGSQETFTVKVYKACSHDIYAHYTLDAKIFQVDPSLPDGKVQLASASTRFSMSRYLRPGEMTLPPPAPGVAAWLDPDPETFAWYVGEWVQFRARTDVSLYLNHHLGVRAYGSEPDQVADQTLAHPPCRVPAGRFRAKIGGIGRGVGWRNRRDLS